MMGNRKKMITLIVTGALALTAVIGAVTYRSAYAQSPTPTPATPGDTQAAPNTQQAQPGRGKGFDGGRRGGFTEQELATALGITTDQLTAAQQTATSEALKQAVSQGLITQAQADQIAANGFGPGLRFLGPNSGIDYDALLAKALGISTDQLSAARQKALTAHLDAAVAAGTMTQAQADLIKGRSALANDANFKSAMQSAYETAIKQAVTDGVITQAQADAILQEQAQKGGALGGFFGGGFGHGRGRHGGPGFNGVPGSNQNNPNNQQVPTTTPSSNGI